MTPETVFVETLDGIAIEVAVSMSSAPSPPATAVIAHPHPLHGGDMHNHVVSSLAAVAANAGCHVITVNFRGVGASGGLHDDGDAERLDLAAACDLANDLAPDAPILLAGYSFGAVVALNVLHPDVRGWLAIAPPVSMMATRPSSATSHLPKVLACPEHDQFGSPRDVRDAAMEWSNSTVSVIPGVDHFMRADAGIACDAALRDLLDRTT